MRLHRHGDRMDEVIRRLNYDVSRGCYAAVVSVTSPLVDAVSAQIDEDAVDVLIDVNEAERTAALALAASRHGVSAGFSDVGRDRSAERLRQLSESQPDRLVARAAVYWPDRPSFAARRSTLHGRPRAVVSRDGPERYSSAPSSRSLLFGGAFRRSGLGHAP